jgi:hypothetical protein
MFNFFKNLFIKQTPQIIQKPIDLSRWDKFLTEPDAGINSVLNQNHIEDIASAIIYTDNIVKQRLFKSAKILKIYNKLEEAIKRKQNISKYESDKAKLLLLSTFEAKGLTILPGFRHS